MIDPKTHPSILNISLDNNKPLIVCDADEVIFDFMSTFECFLNENSLSFNWRSYALEGNIIDKNQKAINKNRIKEVINDFFMQNTSLMPLILGAKKSLCKLSKKYNIIILSNIPYQYYSARKKALNNHNLNFPFYANLGAKGRTISYIYNNFKNKIWFIDDSPYQINSVKKEKKNINTILFVNNSKLSKLINHKKCWDYYSNKWQTNEEILLN